MTDLNVRPWINSTPLTIGPKENLRRARALLRSTKTPELLVVDDGKVVGLLSEQDIWAHCPTSLLVLDEQQAEELLEQIRVGGVMWLHPPLVALDTLLREALQLFAQTGRHALPVIDNGTLVGVLTEARALQATVEILNEVENSATRKLD